MENNQVEPPRDNHVSNHEKKKTHDFETLLKSDGTKYLLSHKKKRKKVSSKAQKKSFQCNCHRSKPKPCIFHQSTATINKQLQKNPNNIVKSLDSLGDDSAKIDLLASCFKIFNKNRLIQALNQAFEMDHQVHLKIPAKIRYIARKYELPRFIVQSILSDLKNRDIDLKIRIFLAQAIKYGVRNNLDVTYEDLFDIIEEDSADIKSEIAWALAYKVKNSGQELTRDLIEKLKKSLTEDMTLEAKSFLRDQLTKHGNTTHDQASQGKRKNAGILGKNLKRKPQTIVTKNQQVAKNIHTHPEAQESSFEIAGILEALKNQQRKIRLNTKVESFPPGIKESKGSHQIWTRGTFTNVKLLYNRAKFEKVITDEDKDEYLTVKFLKKTKYWTGGLLGDLITDRMIAEIFKRISKTQKLNKNTIAKLILCLNDSESLSREIFPELQNCKGILMIKNLFSKKSQELEDMFEDTSPLLSPETLGDMIWIQLNQDIMERRYPFGEDQTYKKMIIEKMLSSKIPEAPDEMIEISNGMQIFKSLKNLSDYDRKKIWNLFLKEIDMIRKDAISALYHCACRDTQILTPEYLKKMEGCLEDKDKVIRGFAVKIFALLSDSQEINYAKVFESCLEQLEQNVELEQSLAFLDQQSKDPKRCQELFKEEAIFRLSNFLKSSVDGYQLKMNCNETINNYLEHPLTKGLKLEVLENICLILKNPNSRNEKINELKEKALISVLLTAEKNSSLPNSIITLLVENLANFDDQHENLILIILGTICDQANTYITCIEGISLKLLDNRVIIGEGSNVTFESPSRSDSSYPAISAIVGRILLSFVKKGNQVSSKVVKLLIEALASHDNQTRILVAKTILFASNKNLAEFSQDILAILEVYVTDNIPDVAIYSTCAYTKILSTFSQGNIFLNFHQMDVLAKVYAYEELKLGNEDFSAPVNKNILEILANQAPKQTFSENIFGIFYYIFMSDDPYKNEALEIIRAYVMSEQVIPDSTVLAIEDVLGRPELANEAKKVLEKVVENGQVVTDKTLKIFADNLYLHNDTEQVRDRDFKVLETADSHQDLSDEIFEVLELQRAGLVIESIDSEDALRFLEIQTQAGRKLPYDVLKALNKQIINPQTWPILINITTNGQFLPRFLIDETSKILDPKKNQTQLIKIFFNLAKNNQDIPDDLLDQLEKRLHRKANSDETLLIFAYRAQKGERLSQNLIKRVSNKFFTTTNQSIKQECLSALYSILQTHGDISQELIEKILVHGLKEENAHLVLTSLSGFEFLSTKTHLSQDSIGALIRKAEHTICPNDLKQRIVQLLNLQALNDSQSNRLKLTTLSCDSEFHLLKTLLEFSKNGEKLLEQNFQQINSIVNESTDFQKATICLLILFYHINDIPEYLIDSIASLMFRTSNQELRNRCIFVIQKIAKSGRKISERAVSLVCAQEETNKVLLKEISKNQEISKVSDLLLQFDSSADLKDPKRLSFLLKNLLIEFDHGLKIPRGCINQLVSLAECSSDDANFQEFVFIFSRALLQDPQYIENRKIVEVIEKAIIEIKEIDLTAVQAYRKLIRSEKCKRLSESLNSLVELLQKKQFEKEHMISFEIFLGVIDAAILGEFCEKGIQLMESNISSPNVRIRRKCFQGLRARKNHGEKSEIFEVYCADLLETLRVYTGIHVNSDLDLLETLASLEYLDLGNLKKLPQDRWIRRLLISDLFAHFKGNYDQRVLLSKKWLKIEEYSKSQNFDSNKILKALAESRPSIFKNLEQVMKFLLKIDLNKACDILSESLHPFQELKQQWLISLLTKCLKNQQASQSYIEQLASNISIKLVTPVISKLFAAVPEVENAMELESLIDFVVENKIKRNHIHLKETSIKNLKRSLGIKLLNDQVRSSIKNDQFVMMLNNLLNNSWSFEKLIVIFKKTESSSAFERRAKEKSLLKALKLLNDYKLPATTSDKILCILDSNMEEWLKKVNEIAVEVNFQASKVKNHVELIAELRNMNPDNASLQDLIQTNLIETIIQIKDTKLMSCMDKIKHPISEWTKAEISTWTQRMKSDPKYMTSPNFFVESLAVIKRANFLHTGFHLTDPQVLSCIAQLKAKTTQGRLLQVGTGEGKSTIVSVIAIIHALKGKKVDIITSSPVLAERDAREKADLYKMFGLSCLDNCDKSLYIKGPKNCYKQDIVYGEISQFQFDTLRDKYSLFGTLAGRECEVAIIDEVDSMLIDDSSNIARLSSTIAGMDRFQMFIVFLWQRLELLQKRFIVINGKNYLLSDKVVQTPNLEDAIEIEGDIETCFKKELERYLREDIIGKEMITIPENFKEFVNIQIPKWTDNAIRALVMQEDKDYVIQEGLVKPVAYDSTGIVQSSTIWGDGLHQFIQLKHGLKMSSETCTTNFLSNIGFINKYGKNLFGLTGTLGSRKAKEVLSNVYNVDLVTIPNLHKKQYLELPTIICKNHDQWLEEICESALHEVSKERGTLIICQTIEHCKRIGSELGQKYRSGAIKLYTMNNMNQEREIDRVKPGEIIVATNLAGRGTDIKTDDIEKNGGLHVIVTFLPPNQRVEDQAFGRTARQGKRGTGQMILNRVALLEYENACPQEIKCLRDNFECEMFDEFIAKDLQMVKTKDELFEEFCNLKTKIRQDITTTSHFWQSSIYKTSLLNALEERWALFLHKIDNDRTPLSQSHQEYDRFKKEIFEDFKKDQLIKNPSYHINIANSFMARRKFGYAASDYKKAAFHYNQAIKLDFKHSAAAYAGRAWLAIEDKGKNGLSKSQIREEFDQCERFLYSEMSELISCQTILQQEYPDMECDLFRQLAQKASLLGNAINSVQNNKATIKKSQRLFDITGTKDYQMNTKSEKKGEKEAEREDYSQDIVKKAMKVYDLEQGSAMNKIDKDFKNHHNEFTVTFHDLTVFYDNGERDQAIETISNALSHNNVFQKLKILNSSVLDPSKYNDLTIALDKQNVEDLRVKFNPDIQIMNVDKKESLRKLKTDFSEADLEIMVDGRKAESYSGLKAKEAIKILEKKKDKKLRCNLLLKKANEAALSLQKDVLKSSILSLEYTNLDFKTAKNRLFKIKFDHLHLEISGTKGEILQALSFPLKHVQLFSSGNNNVAETETFYNDVVRERISQMKDDQVWIKVEDLDIKMADQIINTCPSATFEIAFIGVNLSAILEDPDGQPMRLSFSKLSSTIANNLIPILRKSSLEFTLQFNNLSAQQLDEVIVKASLKQEDLKITKVTKLSDLEMEDNKPNIELAEFAARGIEYLLEINEKRSIPWRSIMTVAALGAVQMALGAFLIVTLSGASVGMGLITEGGADFATALIAYRKRQFRWSDFAKQKAVSLVISATMLGVTNIRDAYNGVKNVVTNVSSEVLEQAGTQAIVNFHYFNHQATQALIQLKKLVIPQIVVTTSQVVAREGFNSVTDSLFNFALEKFKPEISSSVQQKAETKFCEESFRILIGKMWNLDKTLNSQYLSTRIKTILCNIISPENPQNRGLWDSIAKPLCRGFLSDPRIVGSSFSLGLRIVRSLCGLTQITFMIDSIYSQLFEKLSDIDQSLLAIHQILHQSYQIPLDDAIEITNLLKSENVIRIHKYKIPNQNAAQLSKGAKQGLSNLISNGCVALFKEGAESLEISKATLEDCEYINPEMFEISSGPEPILGQKSVRSFKRAQIIKRIKEIDFCKQEKYKDTVLKFCENMQTAALMMNSQSLNEIMKFISDIMTDQIIRVTESHLISPWSTYAVAKFTNSASAMIQTQLIKDQLKSEIEAEKKCLQELQRTKHKTNVELNKIEEYKVEIDEKNEFASHQQITYADQISYEAEKYAIAYTQCKNIYYAQKSSENSKEPPSEKVQDYANQIRKSKPASMADMSSLASHYGKNIKLTKDHHYILTNEEREKNIRIIVYTPGEKHDGVTGVGHYQLMDSNGMLCDIPSNNNDCGFAVMSEILKKDGIDVSVDDLRHQLAERIEENSENSEKIIESQEWVESHSPKEANQILFVGGSLRELSVLEKEIKHEVHPKDVTEERTWHQTCKEIAGALETVTFYRNQSWRSYSQSYWRYFCSNCRSCYYCSKCDQSFCD